MVTDANTLLNAGLLLVVINNIRTNATITSARINLSLAKVSTFARKENENVNDWIREIENAFLIANLTNTTDNNRITRAALVSNYLGGGAKS